MEGRKIIEMKEIRKRFYVGTPNELEGYGREIRIEFYTRLRPEKKFSGIEELKAEILRNADQTRVYFARLEAEGQA